MLHGVCKPADPTIDIEEVVARIYDPLQKILVVKETKGGLHYHFQGTPREDFKPKEFVKEMNANHPLQAISDKRIRPWGFRSKEADDDGFQYMLKEDGAEVCYSVHFTDEELDEIREASKAYREELKSRMPAYVAAKLGKRKFDDPVDLHAAYRTHAFEYYLQEDKLPPPNFQKLVLWHMTKHQACSATKSYVMERI